MKTRGAQGFTMTELMVSTVVAGVLMSVLVSLSGNVQKSFGRVKDTIAVQANLRFAMKMVVDDFQRAAFMYSPVIAQDDCHSFLPMASSSAVTAANPELGASVYFRDGVYHLWGNFVSSRDYRMTLGQGVFGQIQCRNQYPYQRTSRCFPGGGNRAYDPFLEPFNDGPIFPAVFCPGERVRIQVGDGRYLYPRIQAIDYQDDGKVDRPNYQITGFADPPLDPSVRNQIPGDSWWVNPINHVRYEVVPQTATRAQLVRTIAKCRQAGGTGPFTYGDVISPLVDYLLPPANIPPGVEILQYRDMNPVAAVCANNTRWIPQIEKTPAQINTTDANPLDPGRLRALVITLRARTPNEDPELSSTNREQAIDIDTSQQGMAAVRSERTVVELRNLGTNIITND